MSRNTTAFRASFLRAKRPLSSHHDLGKLHVGPGGRLCVFKREKWKELKG